MAFALLPSTALAATATVTLVKITMTAPAVGKPLPTTAKTSSGAKTTITNVEWSGQLDENGNMAYDTEYTAVFTVEIKEGQDAKFGKNAASMAQNATLNGDYVIKSAERVSDTVLKLTYKLPAVKKPSTTITKLDGITVTAPVVGRAPFTDGYTRPSGKVKVTSTTWTGEVDNYGLAMAGVAYTYTFTMEIRPEYDLTFSTGTLEATINGNSDGVKVERVSDKEAIVTYTYPPLEEEEKPESKTFSQAEADAVYPKANPITLVINENTIDMDAFEELVEGEPPLPTAGRAGSFYVGVLRAGKPATYTTLEGEVIDNRLDPTKDRISLNFNDFNYYRVNRIVYDLDFPGDDASIVNFPGVKEVWLSPRCNFDYFFVGLQMAMSSMPVWAFSFTTYDDYTVFIPDSVFPNGPDFSKYQEHFPTPPGCHVMLYSGDDVYEAARKGASAAREWCTNHNFNNDNNDPAHYIPSELSSKISIRDRVYTWGDCQNIRRYYYSCNKCGKCEYNPDHTYAGTAINQGSVGAHQFSVKTVTDEHFLGINDQGDRVYLKCCEVCGKDARQVDLAVTHDYYKNVMGMDDSDPSYYPLYMESQKKSWSPGGAAYKNAMQATPVHDYINGYVVTAEAFITAKTSSWATQNVQVAANDDLVDKALLGEDYTYTINRQQFASIAVKMAEKMLGRAITPAPAGTFTDTDSEYALKAYAAGITTGTTATTFDPYGTLTRQQMATFLYRALQYVKQNSDTEYTVYDSKLGSYTDAGELADWSRDAMVFMNALGLINGTSDTTLSPNLSCTIEQALIVADRSLDAGDIGWYQFVGEGIGAYDPPGSGYFTYGERIWCTSSKGDCVDPRGVACTLPITHFCPIKDR